jgi:fibronectin type 3 domain-containing protein
MKRFSILFLFLTAGVVAFSQNKKTQPVMPVVKDTLKVSIKLQARFQGDSIVLRWGLNNAFAWRKLNETGYNIERLEFDAGNKPEASFKRLNSTPLKPWSEEEWKRRSGSSDNYAMVASKALYGKTFVVAAGGNTKNVKSAVNSVNNLGQAASAEEQRFILAMMSGSFSQTAANGLAIRFTDKSIHKNTKYIYRVFAASTSPMFRTDTALFIIETKKVFSVAPVQDLAVYEGDKLISLRWRDLEHFAGYYIERSVDGKTFSRLSDNPYIQFASQKNSKDDEFTYNDTIPANYKKYYYRIKGISIFSETSETSDIISAQGRDRTPPLQPFIYKAEYKGKNTAIIDWAPYTSSSDMKGFFVSRGQDIKGPFNVLHDNILPPATRNFTDTKVIEGGMNYYVITAVDTAGNIVTSLPRYVVTPDNIAPVKPTGLSGKIDKKGAVTLTWQQGKENDIEGYRIYRANAKDHVFNPISSTVADTIFQDTITLNTLTKHVYYEIVAVDRNKNNSPYSDILELKRPDIIPPVAPVINDFKSGDKSMEIRWVISSSEDVVNQILYRRTKDQEWKVIAQLAQKINVYRDTLVERNNWYEYSLEAVDDAGLHSDKSFPLNVKVYDSGNRPTVQNFNVVKSPDGKSLLLSWKYTEKGDYWFVIYRSVNGNEMMTYQNTRGDLRSFTDSSLTKGTMQYSIKVVYKNGGESKMIKSMPVNFAPSEK